MQNKTMLRQAFTLTAGNIISRFLGLIYVFPFAWLVGPKGQALFSYAYVPYAIFIDLSTLGIPLGVSKFISTYNAQNDYKTAYNIYKKASVIMIIAGIVMFTAMFFIAEPLAYQILGGKTELSNNVRDVVMTIRIISTALLIVPPLALLRGFFQGFKQPSPAAMSQIIEQFVRVFLILASSYIIIKILKYNYPYAIFFAVFSATLAAGAAYLILKASQKQFAEKMKPLIDQSTQANDKTSRELFKELVRYALPLALFGIVTGLYLFIDTMTFNKAYLIRGMAGSEIIFGTYAFEINKLIMIPVTLGIGLGASMLIYVTEAYTKRHFNSVNTEINNALQTCTFIIMPVIIMMMVFSRSVYGLFYQTDNVYGPAILLSYAPLALLFSYNHIFNAAMQGVNKQYFLLFTMLAGVCIKTLYNQSAIVHWGYGGAILMTAFGILVSVGLNALTLVKTASYNHFFIVRRILVIMVLNIFVGAVLYLINGPVLNVEVDYLSRTNCLLYLLINSLLYFTLYISISLATGLLDVITGKVFSFRRFFFFRKNKAVTNHS